MSSKKEFPIFESLTDGDFEPFFFFSPKLEFRRVMLLLDTGCTTSLLARSTVMKDPYLKCLAEDVGEDDEINFHGVHGKKEDKVKQQKITTNELYFDATPFKAEFRITDVVLGGLDGLLGLDFLKAHGAVIDVGRKIITLNVV